MKILFTENQKDQIPINGLEEYKGDLKNELKHGKGILKFLNGD